MPYPQLAYFSHLVDLFDFIRVLFKFECVLIDIYFNSHFSLVKCLDRLLLIIFIHGNARLYIRIN